MRRHSGQSQFDQACRIAKDHNMFVVDKGDFFLLYRKAIPKNAYLGRCNSPTALFRKVSDCAQLKTGATS